MSAAHDRRQDLRRAGSVSALLRSAVGPPDWAGLAGLLAGTLMVKVKASLDPDDFFSFAQSIPTKMPSS